MFRLAFLISSLALMGLVSACGGAKSVDHTDPESVAKAMIEAWRDHDFKALAGLVHPDDSHEFRRLSESSTKTQDMLEYDMFDPDTGEYEDAQNWKGMLQGPKADDGYLLYAFTDPNAYDERTVLVLEQIDAKWYVYEKWYLTSDEFDALPDASAD
ncbi:MAG: hypothetical protein AAGB16_05320 [Pseudomonadota bacterium]